MTYRGIDNPNNPHTDGVSTPPPRIRAFARADEDTALVIGQCISEDVEAYDVRPQRGPLRSTIEVPREHTDMYITRKEDCGCDVHFRVVVFQVREVPEREAPPIEAEQIPLSAEQIADVAAEAQRRTEERMRPFRTKPDPVAMMRPIGANAGDELPSPRESEAPGIVTTHSNATETPAIDPKDIPW